MWQARNGSHEGAGCGARAGGACHQNRALRRFGLPTRGQRIDHRTPPPFRPRIGQAKAGQVALQNTKEFAVFDPVARQACRIDLFKDGGGKPLTLQLIQQIGQ